VNRRRVEGSGKMLGCLALGPETGRKGTGLDPERYHTDTVLAFAFALSFFPERFVIVVADYCCDWNGASGSYEFS
jgi:hypothetical protein